MFFSGLRSHLHLFLRRCLCMGLGIVLALLFSCRDGLSLQHQSDQGTSTPILLADSHQFLMYDQDTLTFWQRRYRQSSQRLLDEALLPVLTSEERQPLQGLQLSVPIEEQPTGFYSQYPPPKIVLPTGALKFLDDLCIAYAWLWANNYSLETIEEYVATLRYQPLEAFGGRYPTPYEALGIPADALNNPEVDSLSIRFFNSARAFILAHELAHLRFQHRGSQVATEIEADAFALDVMARLDTLPMGAVLFFQALAHLTPNQAQFASDTAWETFLQNDQTHPLSSDRMQAIATTLNRRAVDFADPNDPNRSNTVELARFMGENLQTVVDYLDDSELQRCVAETAVNSTLDDLKPRRGGTSRLAC